MANKIGWVVLMVLALAGCAGGSARSMGINEARCQAAGAESLLGQAVDEQVIGQALAGSGGLRTRVIHPGDLVTNDVDPMRLNIQVDETGRILRMVCG